MEKRYNFYGDKDTVLTVTDSIYESVNTPAKLYDVLSEIWCAYTCAPRLRESWTEENKTCGQCSITAFLAQDIFGGKVYGIHLESGSIHCYNEIGDCVFDLTSEQFGDDKLNYNGNPEQSRKVHFSKQEKFERYKYLKAELLKKLR